MDAASGGAAVWWWLGLLVLVLVVVPNLLLVIQRVLRHLSEIRHYADDVLEHGLGIAGNLEPVPALAETRDLVKRVGGGLDGYAAAVDRLL
jgi:4-amino-4-deoxy-L-arabinose transferase-like glycosyltransferase